MTSDSLKEMLYICLPENYTLQDNHERLRGVEGLQMSWDKLTKECGCPIPGTHNESLALLVSEDNAFQAHSPLEEWRGSAIQLSTTPVISRLTNYFPL